MAAYRSATNIPWSPYGSWQGGASIARGKVATAGASSIGQSSDGCLCIQMSSNHPTIVLRLLAEARHEHTFVCDEMATKCMGFFVS